MKPSTRLAKREAHQLRMHMRKERRAADLQEHMERLAEQRQAAMRRLVEYALFRGLVKGVAEQITVDNPDIIRLARMAGADL